MKTALESYKNNYEVKGHIPSILKQGEKSGRIPKISVVIPTYKRADLLKTTLESAIGQKGFTDYEIVIVDNEFADEEKTSDTHKLIQKYNDKKILYYQNAENLGMTGNWNRGIELASGQYITILHDDDWLEPEFLKYVNKKLDGNKLILMKPAIRDYRKEFSFAQKAWKKFKYLIRGIADCLFPKSYLNIKDYYLRNPSYGTLGMVFKREELLNLGGYDEEMYPVMDYWLHAQYCDKFGAVIYKIRKLCNYRISKNESFNVAGQFADKMHLCRKKILKSRASEIRKLGNFLPELYMYDVCNHRKAWNIKINSDSFPRTCTQKIRYIYIKITLQFYILFHM